MFPQRLSFGPRGFYRAKTAVVVFANGRYTTWADRLRSLLRTTSPTIDVYIYHDESEIGAPRHKDSPYAFKVYAIEAVRAKGYEIVMWCDSILTPVRDLSTIVPEIERVGVYLAEDGWKTGMFANDNCLNYFGVTRDEAMNISAIWACFMGFDFKNPVAHEFLRRWKQASLDGAFRGNTFNTNGSESADPRCRGHRHDQSCAELVSYIMKIPRSLPVLHPEKDYQHRYFIGREW